ncbi:hypothetical protein FRB95_014072 [Tulasnella sp. JGI-2019a]|nr:hypothetical protein FRB95_014072 [Tulasnella sp. JGI-2019a]
MRFSSSFLSHAVLVLGYFSTVRSVPINSSSQLVVANNQHPLNEDYTIATPLFNSMLAWLRASLDKNAPYAVVDITWGDSPLVKDHFIELQYIRGYLYLHHPDISVASFYKVVKYANSAKNVFQIPYRLNLYKSGKAMSTWTRNNKMKVYLCADAELLGTTRKVYRIVQGHLDTMIRDPDEIVSATGTWIANEINLRGFRCT